MATSPEGVNAAAAPPLEKEKKGIRFRIPKFFPNRAERREMHSGLDPFPSASFHLELEKLGCFALLCFALLGSPSLDCQYRSCSWKPTLSLNSGAPLDSLHTCRAVAIVNCALVQCPFAVALAPPAAEAFHLNEDDGDDDGKAETGVSSDTSEGTPWGARPPAAARCSPWRPSPAPPVSPSLSVSAPVYLDVDLLPVRNFENRRHERRRRR